MPDSILRSWQTWTLLASGTAWLTVVIGALVATVAGVPSLRRRFWRFLFAPSAPLNLAVLRMVAFGALVILLATEPVREYAAWPRELFHWSTPIGTVLRHLPISVGIVDWLLPIAIVATVMAIAGCFTRLAAWTSVVLATYLLGIPQCAGGVIHLIQPVLLIGVLLACSRAGDAVSIDALWQAICRADRGQVRQLSGKVRYGLPIRLAMMVFVLCYFFPSYWLLVANGWDTLSGSHWSSYLHQRWFELDDYRASLSTHNLPAFTSAVVILALMLALAGPLMLLWRPSRIAWAAAAFLLYSTVHLLTHLGSYLMQALFIMFADWQRLLAWVGRTMFGNPIVVLYDGNCKMCRRTMALLLVLDWLRMLRPINAFDRQRFTTLGLGHLDDTALMTDMHAAENSRSGAWSVTKGYNAYQRIAWRVPLLWTTLPFIYLPPIAAIGRRVYRHVADTRACSVPIAHGPSRGRAGNWSPVPLTVAGVSILAAQVVVGIGWLGGTPLAGYGRPPASMVTSSIEWPEFVAIMADGSTVVLDDVLRHHFSNSHCAHGLSRFVDPQVDRHELQTLLTAYSPVWMAAGYFDGSPPKRLAVYIATYELTGPSRLPEPSERRRLMDFLWDEISR